MVSEAILPSHLGFVLFTSPIFCGSDLESNKIFTSGRRHHFLATFPCNIFWHIGSWQHFFVIKARTKGRYGKCAPTINSFLQEQPKLQLTQFFIAVRNCNVNSNSLG